MGEFFAAGEEDAALVGDGGEFFDDGVVVFGSKAVFSGLVAGSEDGFGVIEDEEAAVLFEEIEELTGLLIEGALIEG